MARPPEMPSGYIIAIKMPIVKKVAPQVEQFGAV
jgi:hypothetical protein